MVKVDSSLAHHKTAYRVVKKYYEEELGYECDKTDDATRLCFLSYDPEAFLNFDFETFPVNNTLVSSNVAAPVPTETTKGDISGNFESLFDRAVKFTENKSQFSAGNRNNFVFLLACNCNSYGIPQAVALSLCIKRYETHDFDTKEINTVITSAYKNTEQFGTQQQVAHNSSIPESISTDYEQIPDSVYENLPGILKSITSYFDSNHERDLILLSTLCTCSTLFPHVQGKYDRKKVGLNLFLFITATSSAGKSVITWSKMLTSKIAEYLKKKYINERRKYLEEYEKYITDKKNNPGTLPPVEPKEKYIVIPANTSSSMLIEMLYNNENFGLMYETEADALVTTTKNDWGDFSYILRLAFHHEAISLARRNNKEVKRVERPHLSGVFSGIFSLLKSFILGVESGYFSRFMHYIFNAPIEWVDKFEDDGEDLGGVFEDYAEQFLYVWQKYEGADSVTVTIPHYQRKKIASFFSSRLHQLTAVYGNDIGASVKRHALIAYRIAMLLTVLRRLTDGVELDQEMYVGDTDLETTLQITDVLLKHLTVAFSTLQGESNTTRFKTKKRTLLDRLPHVFTTEECSKLADELGIARKTAETYLRQLTDEGLLEHAERGKYCKKK